MKFRPFGAACPTVSRTDSHLLLIGRLTRVATLIATTLLLLSPAQSLPIDDFDDIDMWFGSGPNRAALVIDFNDGFSIDSFAWGYRWSGTKSGADMFIDIVAGDPNLSAGYTGDGDSGFFLTSINYNDGTNSHSAISGGFTDPLVDYVSWGYYVVGGFSGDDVPFAPGGSPVPISGGGVSLPLTWTLSNSGASLDSIGDSGRILEDGSWDGWTFGTYDAGFNWIGSAPSAPTAAIPEPSSVALALLGVAGITGLIGRQDKGTRHAS